MTNEQKYDKTYCKTWATSEDSDQPAHVPSTASWLSKEGCTDFRTNEQKYDKTYYKTWATSEDSDQPAHPRSLS